MPSVKDVVRSHTELDDADLAWLQLLIADWQVIADLSFADLVLWLPDREGHGYWGGAQMRPTTAPTAIVDDLVGAFVPRGRRALLDSAFEDRRIAREGDPEWRDDVPVRVETIPVMRECKLLGVIARNTNLLGIRPPSRLELSYLQTASDLTKMISLGRFPQPVERREWSASPRVGDGFVRVDASGVVSYASPNAQSAYGRLGLLGDLLGQRFAATTEELVPQPTGPVAESLAVTLSGRTPSEAEFGNAEATIIARVIPLQPGEQHDGAAVLLRDVTELRNRERELITKDATIREIHHRVKNNLQTVAALLRLQGRRLQSVEAREALAESVRRIASIALVHETLSQESTEHVDFAKVARRIIDMLADGLTDPDIPVLFVMEGEPGDLPAAVATPLALVLTELLANCIEHAYPAAQDDAAAAGGAVRISFSHDGPVLGVEVSDDGVGLPEGLTLDAVANLGLQIARTLVESELGGTFSARSDRSGTSIRLALPLR